MVHVHVPGTAGDSAMPAVMAFSICLSGAAGSAKTTRSGFTDETPVSLYSVRPGASTA